MKVFHGIFLVLCAAGLAIASAGLPAAAANMAVKATVAVPVVTCSSWSWTHGWLDHGGWGGWGYYDGLAIDDWAGSCDALLGASPYGPYAYAPRESRPARAKR